MEFATYSVCSCLSTLKNILLKQQVKQKQQSLGLTIFLPIVVCLCQKLSH